MNTAFLTSVLQVVTPSSSMPTRFSQAAEYLFGEKSKWFVRGFWVVAIVVGSQTTLGFVWDLADTFNGLMIIPNLIGILILSNEVVKEKKAYFEANGMK